MSHFLTSDGKKLYGLMAEFDSPEKLIRACEAASEAGYKRLGAYTPYPIEEVWEAIGHHRSKLPLIVLGGGLVGAIGGFLFQVWASVQETRTGWPGGPLMKFELLAPRTVFLPSKVSWLR